MRGRRARDRVSLGDCRDRPLRRDGGVDDRAVAPRALGRVRSEGARHAARLPQHVRRAAAASRLGLVHAARPHSRGSGAVVRTSRAGERRRDRLLRGGVSPHGRRRAGAPTRRPPAPVAAGDGARARRRRRDRRASAAARALRWSVGPHRRVRGARRGVRRHGRAARAGVAVPADCAPRMLAVPDATSRRTAGTRDRGRTARRVRPAAPRVGGAPRQPAQHARRDLSRRRVLPLRRAAFPHALGAGRRRRRARLLVRLQLLQGRRPRRPRDGALRQRRPRAGAAADGPRRRLAPPRRPRARRHPDGGAVDDVRRQSRVRAEARRHVCRRPAVHPAHAVADAAARCAGGVRRAAGRPHRRP